MSPFLDTSFPSSSTIRTSNPGMGLPADPGLMGIIGDPDSDDHQLSITPASGAQCLARRFWYIETIAGSDRSPARNRARKLLSAPRRPLPSKNLLSGSSLRIARSAVGAVNSELTLFSSMIRQNVSASGVPTGLPSNKTVVAPARRGA
ncbi:hypothetical protein KC330_g164 [Hortaea werneckii]|nr:hypothetical protein KC330_g164 [Hortaea werneckii]